MQEHFQFIFGQKKEFSKYPSITFDARITKIKLTGDKVNLNVKCSLGKGETNWTGRFKEKSKNFKYKINITGYQKNRLDIIMKEVLVWALKIIKKIQF